MTTRAEAVAVVTDRVMADFSASVGSGEPPAEMMEAVTAGIDAHSQLAVDALSDAGMLVLD